MLTSSNRNPPKRIEYDNKIIYAHNQEFTREKLLTNCLNMYYMHWYGTKLRKMQKKRKRNSEENSAQS